MDRAGAKAGHSHSRELQTGDSHRETAQTKTQRARRCALVQAHKVGHVAGRSGKRKPYQLRTIGEEFDAPRYSQPLKGECDQRVSPYNTPAQTRTMNNGHETKPSKKGDKLLRCLPPRARSSRRRAACLPAGEDCTAATNSVHRGVSELQQPIHPSKSPLPFRLCNSGSRLTPLLLGGAAVARATQRKTP